MSASARRPIKRGILLGLRYGWQDADRCLAEDAGSCPRRGLAERRRCAARHAAYAGELPCSACPLAPADEGRE